MEGATHWFNSKFEDKLGRLNIQDFCDCLEYGTRT